MPSASIPRGYGVHNTPKFLCSAPGLTPDRNTEQTWLGEARNREVSAPGTQPQSEKGRGRETGTRARGWAGPGSSRTRNANTPVPGRRPRLALQLLPEPSGWAPSPARNPGSAHPGGSRGSLVLFAPPGRRRGADGQVAKSGGGQSPLPLVGGGDGAQRFPAGRSCSPGGSSWPGFSAHALAEVTTSGPAPGAAEGGSGDRASSQNPQRPSSLRRRGCPGWLSAAGWIPCLVAREPALLRLTLFLSVSEETSSCCLKGPVLSSGLPLLNITLTILQSECRGWQKAHVFRGGSQILKNLLKSFSLPHPPTPAPPLSRVRGWPWTPPWVVE